MPVKNVLKAQTDAELLSYIINSTPELQEIDLPVQGQSIKPYGKLIMDNERYKNAFINAVNLIGLTLIKRNAWENPWDFTQRGTLRFGQQIRELILDLCHVYDYNENFSNKTRFLQSEVPNVFSYTHEVNFQKFYQTTTSDVQMSMAFETEGGLFDFIAQAVSMLYESWQYDKYIVDKYMLCRRILEGTVPSSAVDNWDNITPRQRVSAIKSVSNKMTFRSPNYNPAAVNRATRFDEQILIVSTEFEAEFSTEVLATSYFKDEADMRSRMVLIDGFDNHDTARLAEVLGTAFENFTETELTALSKVTGLIISNQFFMDYLYSLDNASDNGAGMRQTQFYNPTTLENNHFLHVWGVFSTSPFENSTVFTAGITPAVTSVSVSPATANVSVNQKVQLNAVVETEGFANKAVIWSITSGEGANVNQSGLVTVTKAGTVEVTATSVFDSSKTAKATLTVA